MTLLNCYNRLFSLTDFQSTIQSEFPSAVVIERYGMNGSICPSAWDDEDANVLCRENGYHGGIALNGPLNVFIAFYMLSPQCNGTELRLSDCPSEPYTFRCVDYYNRYKPEIFCYYSSGKLIYLQVDLDIIDCINICSFFNDHLLDN